MRLSTSSRRARRVAIALSVCLASSFFAGNLAAADTRSAPAAAPVYTAPVYTLHKANLGISPGTGFFLDEAHIRSGLDDFKALGAHWIRSTIPWQNFEPDDPAKLPHGTPEYNWKGVDAFVATLRQPQYAGRFSLIVTVETPPAWATVRSRIGHIACAIQAPFDLASYARATAALAEHLKASAHVFEVENSPNIGTRGAVHRVTDAWWSPPNPCGYAQLLKLTTAAVHKLGIGAKVLVGGLGGTKDIPRQRIAADEFLADLYANGARGAFDGVSFHPYSTPQLPCAASDKICAFDPNPTHKDPYGMTNGWDRMLNARRIMVAHGDGAKQLWITEFGGPTTSGTRATGKMLTESQQAALLTAGMERASQYPWVAEFSWFTYIDGFGSPQSDPTGTFMGLLRKDGTRKPAFFTYARLAASAR